MGSRPGRFGSIQTRAHKPPPARPPAERPPLLLLTSLQLVFGEQFSLQGGGSPALKRLQGRYRVLPISVTSPAELAKGRLLLMAQPLAQTAENLVALDDWVRGGGRVVILADPLLEWPSKRPLGDPLRPPPMFADTGLLGHWGLRLDAPDERGAAVRTLAGYLNLGGVRPADMPYVLDQGEDADVLVYDETDYVATWDALIADVHYEQNADSLPVLHPDLEEQLLRLTSRLANGHTLIILPNVNT